MGWGVLGLFVPETADTCAKDWAWMECVASPCASAHPESSADPPVTSGFTPLSLENNGLHIVLLCCHRGGGWGEGVNLPVLAGTSGLFLLVIYRTHRHLPAQHQGIGQRIEASPHHLVSSAKCLWTDGLAPLRLVSSC